YESWPRSITMRSAKNSEPVFALWPRGPTLHTVLSLRSRQQLAPVIRTLAGWLVAFGVVTMLLAVFGHQLATMPLALRALVMSGVLVTLMVNLAMPLLSAGLARWLRGAQTTRGPEVSDDPAPVPSVAPEHARLETLPDWPARTIAVLSTVDQGAYAIP